MAETALVAEKFTELSRFARILEAADPKPRAIVYATYSDTTDEALLVVPAAEELRDRETYQRISRLLSSKRQDFPSIDISDIRLVSPDEPYIRGLSAHLYVENSSTITIQKSVFDGVFVEYAVIFLMVLPKRALQPLGGTPS